MSEIDPVIDAHIARVMNEARAKVWAEDGLEPPVIAASPPPATPASPPAPTDVSAAMVEAVFDLGRDDIRTQVVGPLLGIPADPRQPPPVREAAAVIAQAGPWLAELANSSIAVVSVLNPKDRAEAFIGFEDEAAATGHFYVAKLKDLAAQLKVESERMRVLARTPGEELPADLVREVRAFFFGLDDAGRDAFLREAERRRDAKALRAIAGSALLPYRAPKVTPDDLLETAGRIQFPNATVLARAYAKIAERLTKAADTIGARTTESLRRAAQHVDHDTVANMRHGIAMHRRQRVV